MLGLSPELHEHLQRDGTLIVPSRQRAAALRLAFGAAQLAAGRAVWRSPDILPWNAWLERELADARARGEPVPRRLSAFEDWLLWREAAEEACSGLDLLQIDSLVDALRRAAGLLADYGLTLREPLNAEAGVLKRASAHYRLRCRELGVIAASDWRAARDFVRVSARLWLAGFEALGPERERWLTAGGARLVEPAAAAVTPQLLSWDDPAREAQGAAQWCARQLERDPHARLLLIVPRLAEQRALWQRALALELDRGALMGAAGPSAFVIEGGLPLAQYPLVRTALDLLSLLVNQSRFDAFSALLRTPYLELDPAARLRLEVWLREHGADASELALLRVLPELMGEQADESINALLKSVAALRELLQGAPARPAVWAQVFAEFLARAGWPGKQALSSDEQQVRMRFDELLGEFGAVSFGVERVSAPAAVGLLRELVARNAFEPASDDVPVTVTASLEDPLLRYDGVWIAGLTADVWPAASRPDPFVPWGLQRAAGVPEASPEGMLARARRQLARWQRTGAHCVVSVARTEADLPRDPSPLLEALTAVAAQPQSDLMGWWAAQAPPLEAWRDTLGPAWPRERLLRGGTRLLELQALCPFRSFAEIRLGATSLPLPQPGIDPRLRGRILHRAVEHFWRGVHDSTQLHALGVDGARAASRRAVARTFEDLANETLMVSALGAAGAALLRAERERTERLLDQLLEWELAREPFKVQALEWSQTLTLAGASLRLRLDRVDRLQDGRIAVIDYKSGSATAFDADAERPTQPQLPAYATVTGADTAVVLALYLSREGAKARGSADRAGRVARIGAAGEDVHVWNGLLERWRERLHSLVQEFVSGQAAVQPQPKACQYCHLRLLCRLDAQALAAQTAESAEAGEEDTVS